MTTEIWIKGHKDETKITIPNNSRLESASKRELIQNLLARRPPRQPQDAPTLIIRLGRITDKGTTTVIQTPQKVYYLSRGVTNTNTKPLIIQHQTEAEVTLPGYGSTNPVIVVRNVKTT